MEAAAWPSDRSWTNVGLLMAGCDSVYASKAVRAKLVYGCVGHGAGNEFLAWLGADQLPDPEQLLARPDDVELPKRFDLVRTMIGSVFAAVTENRTPERWEAAFDFLETVYGQSAEAAMSAEGALWRIKPDGHKPKDRNGAAAEMRKARLGV